MLQRKADANPPSPRPPCELPWREGDLVYSVVIGRIPGVRSARQSGPPTGRLPHNEVRGPDLRRVITARLDDEVRSVMRDHLRRCLIGAFALVSIGSPATALATPGISRADGDCARGWGWSAELNQCVFLLPAANGPGGPGGARGTGRTRRTWGTGRPGASRAALIPSPSCGNATPGRRNSWSAARGNSSRRPVVISAK